MKQFGQVPITVLIPFGTIDPSSDAELITFSRGFFLATDQGLASNCCKNSPAVRCSIRLPSKSLCSHSPRPNWAKMSASGGLRAVEAFIRMLKDVCAVPTVECHSDKSSFAMFDFDISSNSTRAFYELYVNFERSSPGFNAAIFSKLYCARLQPAILRKMLLLDEILYAIAKVSCIDRVFVIHP